MKSPSHMLRGNQRGSGIITVLVTVLFISALGAALLFVSYTGYQIRLSERKSKENFYNADTAMSTIRSGLQQAVTESTAAAYTNLLEHYASFNADYETSVTSGSPLAENFNAYLETEFYDEFKTALLQWRDAGNSKLFRGSGDSYTYSPAVLLNILDPTDKGTKTIDEDKNIYRLSADGATVYLDCDGGIVIDSSALTLKGITVRYIGKNGYLTGITTDITVHYPPFSYAPPAYSVANLAGFSLIAKDCVECVTQNLTLTGDAYAGKVSVTACGASLTHQEGTIISGGDVIAENSGAFKTAKNSSLWANNIEVGDAGMELLGNTYVADDLALSGSNANAKLQGNYYGFGNSDFDAVNSSSILVNGRNTSLDLAGLKSLMLAGNSFIDASGANSGNGRYIMGQSVAVRSDQLAYLVPEECLPTGLASNPYIVTQKMTEEQINGVMSKLKTLQTQAPYYRYVDGVKDVYLHLNSTGSKMIAYLFLTFRSRDHANQYFKGYFSQHAAHIDEYLTNYLASYHAAQSVMCSGNTYMGTVESDVVSKNGLEDAADASAMFAAAKQYQSQYRNLCTTLSTSLSSHAANPYEYIINTSAVEHLSDRVTNFTNASGKTLAVIIKGDYIIEGGDVSPPKIVIATGDIVVKEDFHGLIISGGTVTMQASIAMDSGVSAALQAVDKNGKTVLSYMNIGSNTGGGSSGAAGGNSWEVMDLVKYSNWSRS